MHTENLIIGQGICGTLLCYELQKAGQSFLVIDEPRPFSASKIASGIINPVTGRRLVKTWMIDELLPFLLKSYIGLGLELGIECIEQKDVIDFFPSPQMRLAFLNRLEEDGQYLSLQKDIIEWSAYLNYDFEYGIIHPCYLVDVVKLIEAFRKKLVKRNFLLEAYFDIAQLSVENNRITYKNITAEKIIFCDGTAGAENPYFKNLPFAPNKGEALIVKIKDLPGTHILKRGLNLVPWGEDLFWAGSSYEWQFEHDQPTTLFREKTVEQLNTFLKVPFTVVDHWASIRPATLERRPFVGFHPLHPTIGIFNGMGTKGCSLAPYFAAQFVQYISKGTALSADVDVHRFKKVLSRV
ncbi:MAG: FAD-binding oxidoreductase [Williamsia sp.]|nr:FAD-binding oxidoreductase [Williamsia sp.]